jgi:two-component system alkaline phosphatase synthesis response regulator PhoP
MPTEALMTKVTNPIQQPKILVVDDSEVVLEVTEYMLRSTGHDVVTCNTPIGVTLVAAREKPALILVDLDMASMGGDRVVTSLKASTRTAGIPVLIHSDRAAAELEAAAAKSGADGFIQKTSDAAVLSQQIQSHLER